MAVVIFLLAWPLARDDRDRVLRLVPCTLLALGESFCFAGCFFTTHARGSGYRVGAGYTYVSDALNFFVPTRITWPGATRSIR